jgi:hypothetical protein
MAKKKENISSAKVALYCRVSNKNLNATLKR